MFARHIQITYLALHVQLLWTSHRRASILPTIKIVQLGQEIRLICRHVHLVLPTVVAHVLAAHVLLHAHVWHLLLHAAEATRVIPSTVAAYALSATRLAASWALAKGETAYHAWRSNLSNSLRPRVGRLLVFFRHHAQAVFAFHAEEVTGAG